MEPPVFYATPEQVSSDIVTLDESETHHARKVMRLSAGALVIIVDGLGTAYRGELSKLGTKKSEVKIHSVVRNFGEPDTMVTLASGLSTGYKFDTVVEKATELGVRRIVPLVTFKSKITLDDPKRVKTKLTRYRKVAIAAMKQCRRAYIPEICPPRKFVDFMTEIDPNSLNLIFHPGANSTSFDQLDIPGNTKRVTLLVGPESGFSSDEIMTAAENHCRQVSVGQRILRTETAGPVLTALVMMRLGEFR